MNRILAITSKAIPPLPVIFRMRPSAISVVAIPITFGPMT